MQQKQLLRILDIVPDCVYICTQDRKGLYANQKINEFFGRDLIKRTSGRVI